MNRSTLGRLGEWIALTLLLAKGYRPRHRNWRGAGGEIDIVVERRREIVFVEVKARSSSDFGGAAASVTRDKQRTLFRVASAYLSRHELWHRPCRYDVVTVERRAAFPYWSVRHYRNALSPDLGRQM